MAKLINVDSSLKPWDRLVKEPPKAFAAFCVYRDLGAKRSVDKAYLAAGGLKLDQKGRAPRRWFEWSRVHKWSDRAQAWDAHLNSLLETQREVAVRDAADRLEQRRRTHADNEVALSSLLGERLAEMLKRPIYRQVHVKGPNGEDVVQEMLNQEWSYAHVSQLFKVMSQVMRLALGMKTDEDDEPDGTRFHEFFYRTRGQMAARIPAGVMPEMPVDSNAKPVMKLSPSTLADAGVPGYENGNGGNGENGNGKPPKVRPQ